MTAKGKTDRRKTKVLSEGVVRAFAAMSWRCWR